jgi:hypothetical protein
VHAGNCRRRRLGRLRGWGRRRLGLETLTATLLYGDDAGWMGQATTTRANWVARPRRRTGEAS